MPAPASSYGYQGLSFQLRQSYIQDALQAYTNGGTRSPPPETDVLYIVPTRNSDYTINRSNKFIGAISTRDGKYVAKRTITFGTDAVFHWGFKVLNHKTGHAMCMPDYYPLSGGSPGYYVGGCSAMGDIGGVGSDFFAWDKWRLGWLADEAFDCVAERGTSQHTIAPLGASGGKKAVVVAVNQTAALVGEVRTAKGLGSHVCAPGILLLYG